MSAKNYRLWTVLIILLGAIGIGSIGFSLITRYLQTQQNLQTQAANNLLAQKQYDSALESYDRLLATEIPSDRLWTNRGYALLGLERYEEALESCTTATSIEPKADLAWNCRGEALYYLDRSNDALAAFERAIAVNPRNPTFQLNQGKVLREMSQHEEAIEVLSRVISLLESQTQDLKTKEDIAIAFNDLGHSALAIRQNKRALAAFEQSLTYRPEFLAAQQGKGAALYRLGGYQQAIAIFDELQERELSSEQQAINWLYKGISLCHTPQADKAAEAFAKVIELTDNSQSRQIAQAGCGIR